jgi:hypothetical protein
MCDFSLHAVRSRPAKVGDKLTTRLFHMGTTGFCAPEDERMAVCLLPGTELSNSHGRIAWKATPQLRNYLMDLLRDAEADLEDI